MVAFGSMVFMITWDVGLLASGWMILTFLRVMMMYLYFNFGAIACDDDLLASGLVILIATYTISSCHLN